MLSALLIVGAALAGVVADVPRGETRASLVVCRAEDPCAQHALWIESLEGEGDRPLLPVDAVLVLDGVEMEGGETLEAKFAGAVARARHLWDERRLPEADIALDDAARALERWSGTPATDALFELHYLRGAVAVARGGDPTDTFRQAAAVAWNRSVTLPVADGPAAQAYYAALPALLAEGTGTLRLAPPPDGASWYLDGVELGPREARVDVLPGVHRVTASSPTRVRTWRKDVMVQTGRAREVSAAFTAADDATWVRTQLLALYDGSPLPREVAAMLTAWCERRNVHDLRLLRVREDASGGYLLDKVVYDPRLKRVVRD